MVNCSLCISCIPVFSKRNAVLKTFNVGWFPYSTNVIDIFVAILYISVNSVRLLISCLGKKDSYTDTLTVERF